MAELPPFAPFPAADIVRELDPGEWDQTIASWDTLAEAYLTREASPCQTDFLLGFFHEVSGHENLLYVPHGQSLWVRCFQLVERHLSSSTPPEALQELTFLLDVSSISWTNSGRLRDLLTSQLKAPPVERGISTLKKWLVAQLEAGLGGEITELEKCLCRLNNFLHACPEAAPVFLAGSDFTDGLISCYKIMNPPLRGAILSTTYLCLKGLTQVEPPQYGILTDQLYSFKSAAEAHKNGPLNVNDSLVAELVTQTPLLQKVRQSAEGANATRPRLQTVLDDLKAFKKPGGMRKPRKTDKKTKKGKGIALGDFEDADEELHIHRMSQITQVQDVFPDLGSGFISRLLDSLGGDTERVIASLLDDTLPDHLVEADRSEDLQAPRPRRRSSLVPHHHTSDNDGDLAFDVSKLTFGKSDTVAADEPQDLEVDNTSQNKAAILAALAKFDSDDDERDDTYDADDVGGAIDTNNEEEISTAREHMDEALFKAYAADPALFARDPVTRNGIGRARLRVDTGLTDEAIEGWAMVLERDPGKKRKMEIQFALAKPVQPVLKPTHWRASKSDSGQELASGEEVDSDVSSSSRVSRGSSGRGRGRGI